MRRSASSMRRSRPASRGSSTSRPSTSSATPTAGSWTRRTTATSPKASSATTTRRSTWLTSRRRPGSRRGRPSSSSSPGRSTALATIPGSGRRLKAAYDGIGAVHRLRRAPASRRPTSTTSPAASSAALDRGRLGEAYILTADEHGARGGDAHRGPPRRAKAAAPVDPERRAAYRCRVCAPNSAALCSASPRTCARSSAAADGVTYWASNAKAVAELGFVPRSLEVGLVDAFGTD